MNALRQKLEQMGLGGVSPMSLAGPVLVLLILAMMIIPLPPLALDMLFTFNIAISIFVIMNVIDTKKPLEFSSFPAILLFTTLLRLSLNVASTRVVLVHGHEGPHAAGKVIEAFGEFLVGGNYAVGIAVFAILVVINFMVITKGAGRIAEVAARFTLDAMPGKQMAIDADLNSGMINEEEARRRRKEVAQESDFHGAMDGASKFVRGDAIAGILIMVINILVGLFIGVLQHDLSFGDAARTYTVLTIGDGLVAQIPALVISIAAGLIVSRVNTDEDVNKQVLGQIFAKPVVIYIAAGVMGLLGIVPGMPHSAFLTLAVLIAGLGYWINKKQEEAIFAEGDQHQVMEAVRETAEASWNDVQFTDELSLEVGHRLITLVDKRQDGTLLSRVKNIRMTFARELGFLPPEVHIKDNLELQPDTYVISMKGVEIGRGQIFPGDWMAIDNGELLGTIEGVPTLEPTFGLNAVWISEEKIDQAQVFGYTTVDASTVAATHLNHLMRTHAQGLLGRSEVQQLMKKLADENAQLVEDVVPKHLTSTQLQRILQALLEEDVSIKDLRTIFETLAEHAPDHVNDHQGLVALVRVALGRAITFQAFGPVSVLKFAGLDPSLETMLEQAIPNGAFAPNIAQILIDGVGRSIAEMDALGLPHVVVTTEPIRPMLSEYLRRKYRHLFVLSYEEIPRDSSYQLVSTIRGIN